MLLALRWRLLVSAPADGATNMAVDHALLERAATADEAVLRIYSWERPTISLGLHERARFTEAAAAEAGIDVVRRPTGGRALLHHREVTYSVTAPTAAGSLSESYRAINNILLAALTKLGVTANEAERKGRPLRPDGAACFAEPNAGELVLQGRKLVGSAQRRDEHAFLQHGSILLADDQALVAQVRGQGDKLPSAATLNEALQREVRVGEVVAALSASLEGLSEATVIALHDEELRSGITQHLAHYRDSRWTYRR